MADTLYYFKARVKALLDFNHTDDDTLLDNLGAVATIHTDEILRPFADLVPFAGAGITEMIKSITEKEVVADYKLVTKEFEAEKAWRNKRKDDIETLEKSFNAQQTTRKKWIAVTKPYVTEPLASE